MSEVTDKPGLPDAYPAFTYAVNLAYIPDLHNLQLLTPIYAPVVSVYDTANQEEVKIELQPLNH